MYGAEKVTFEEPAILTQHKRSVYKEDMSDEEMYEATRQDAWSISLDKVKGRIGIACYGISEGH